MGHILLGALPLFVAGLALYWAVSGGYAAGDLTHTFLPVGRRELHGGDPYAWTRAQIAAQLAFPYPGLTVVLLEPLALLPVGLASVLYLSLCAGAILGALWVLGVRDWRVYGAVALWSPVVIGWQTGNFTLPLVLAVALAWRYRDEPWLVGLIAALMISIKPIMFPVVVWLLVTRRYRATAWTGAFGLALNAAAWTVIGWGEVSRWLHLVSTQSEVMYKDGYGIIALLGQLGLSRAGGTAVMAVISLACCAGCLHLARRGQDQAAFIISVGLMLVCSPKIDQHYLALLVVPLALTRPRLSRLWLAPLLVWVCPATGATAWQIAVWWVVVVLVLVRAVQSAGVSGEAEDRGELRHGRPSVPPDIRTGQGGVVTLRRPA